jgi:hypothetical protein
MTEEEKEINIGIAQACGKTNLYLTPDYLNDLNAMHEAWMSRNDDERIQMHQKLMDIVNRDFPKDKDGFGLRENMPTEHWVILTFEATARQRAEAFLRALDLWKE